MDTFERLAALGESMQVEAAGEVDLDKAPACPVIGAGEHPEPRSMPAGGWPISMVSTPKGPMPVLKSLLTSACERNCNYCCFRAGRNFRRETFKPEEMAGAVVKMTQKGLIKGAFISSGIAGGGVRTQDRLLDMADILRNKLHYRGYLHLKLMPGVEYDQVMRAMQLSDRVSVNLEGANPQRLQTLAPMKVFTEELLRPLRWIEKIRQELPARLGWNSHWSSSVTQFVVGPAGEADLELLSTTAYLHRQAGLARAYFSGFSPILDTPFENLPPENPWRQHRLYQASFLLRDYGFELEELPFTGRGNLPLDTDPKLAWARDNLGETPVEINRADRSQLLKIPGFGPKGVMAILQARRTNRLRSLDDLKAIGVITGRAAPFILLDGRRPDYQARLF